MRSVPAGSFERIADPANLWEAWEQYSDDRRRRPDVAWFLFMADRHIFAMSRRLLAGTWRPGGIRVRLAHDPKPRLVMAAPVRDRVLQHAVVAELAPHYERSFIHHNYGWSQGRGPHRAAIAVQGWSRTNRFRLKLGVANFFPSIQHDRLLGIFARRLRCARTLQLVRAMVEAGASAYGHPLAERVLTAPVLPGHGLAMGSYLSNFAAHLYLDGADQFIKRELKVQAYLRYMNGLLLFHDDPAFLAGAHTRLAAWLAEERGLSLDPGRILDNRRPMVFHGYRISREGLEASSKLMKKLRRRLKAAAARGPVALERTVASYRGLALL